MIAIRVRGSFFFFFFQIWNDNKGSHLLTSFLGQIYCNCTPNYYPSGLCSVHCENSTTCNGNGYCNSNTGLPCICNPGKRREETWRSRETSSRGKTKAKAKAEESRTEETKEKPRRSRREREQTRIRRNSVEEAFLYLPLFHIPFSLSLSLVLRFLRSLV